MSDKFFDVRTHKMQKGQVLARFSAMADLLNGPEKNQLVKLLQEKETAVSTIKIMQKLLSACELDAIQVPLRMAQDLKSGLSVKQVLKKLYRYKIELYFYAAIEDVPLTPHWEIIHIYDTRGKISMQTN